MQRWTRFLEAHPHPHLVIGLTRSVPQWRDNAFLRLINAQQPSGRFSFRRDFDPEKARYLLLAAFEKEADAAKLAVALGAEEFAGYPGYASQRVFEFGAASVKKLNAALRQVRVARRSLPAGATADVPAKPPES